MSGEIVISETPNWLNALEEKREKRLKARLGHEAGAGAPCLKCQDKCPGLDLHFWRKACKICRCPKEEHDVPDDDVYGWAQFQLLGSKPNKIKTKIVLNGKNEVELDWAPKGQQETVDNYLKTLPPEALPVKGSQAAQERKQLLQKQIPVHDIDPSLCHELNEEETKKMEEYIDNLKKNSVGVGQIVNLSNIIKANLHNINPQDAHIIASRYTKGVPFSEIVKLQSGLAQNLENLTLKNAKSQKNKTNLSKLQPQSVNLSEQVVQNPSMETKYKDIVHPWYENEGNKGSNMLPQYAKGFRDQSSGHKNSEPNYLIDDKLLQGTNFDPTKTPSQFSGYHVPYKPQSDRGESFNSLPGYKNQPEGDKYGFENPLFGQKSPLKPYNTLTDQQSPKPPRSIKDLIYSTYDPKSGPIPDYDASNDIKNNAGLSPPNLVLNTYKHTPGEAKFEHPNVLNKESCKPYKPGYFDPKSGKFVPNSDRNYPKNVLGPVYVDPNSGMPVIQFEPGKSEIQDLQGPFYINPESGDLIPNHELGKEAIQNALPPNYVDPKTGKLIPEYELGKYDPRHSQFEPQNAQGPIYVDPRTGKPIPGLKPVKYVPQDVLGPVYIDPSTRKPILKMDPGRYDAQDIQGPYYIDPKTGNLIPGDLLGDKVIQNALQPLYVHPITRKPIPEFELGRYDPRHSQYDPQKYQAPIYIDPRTGKPIPELKYENDVPQDVLGPIYVNPKTGKPILKFEPGKYNPSDVQEPLYINPETGNLIPECALGKDSIQNALPPIYVDPKTGKQIPDFDLGKYDPNHSHYDHQNTQGPVYVDPRSGKPIPGLKLGKYFPLGVLGPVYVDPSTCEPILKLDPGRYDPQNIQGPFYIDPKTGTLIPGYELGEQDIQKALQPLYVDPKTGNPIPEFELGKYDPKHSQYDPQNVQRPICVDPTSGKPIPELKYLPKDLLGPVYIHPKTETPFLKFEPGKYDPSDIQEPFYINPKTGDLIPEHELSKDRIQNSLQPVYVDAKTGKPIAEFELVKYDLNHSHYDPQNGQGPIYVDPRTGRSVPPLRLGKSASNVLGPVYVDPSTTKPILKLDPRIYDPQDIQGPFYIDPITGNLIPGHELGQQDIQNALEPIYVDSKTGKPIPESELGRYDPKHPHYDPQNIQGPIYVDPRTGKAIPDLNLGSVPQNIVGPVYVDPRLGKPILKFEPGQYDVEDVKGPFYIDPQTGNLIPGYALRQRDVENAPEPVYVDPKTSQPIPEFELGKYDPNHPQYDPRNAQGLIYVDPRTGKPIPRLNLGEYDPKNPNYDQEALRPDYMNPQTGKPIPKAQFGRYDPITGQYIPLPKNYNPSNQKSVKNTGGVTPKRGGTPGLGYIDPKTGNFVPGNSDTSPLKNKKPLSHLRPGEFSISEDYLKPHMVNVGSIQDINPEIKGAKTEINPGYESDESGEFSPNTIKEILNNIMLPECHHCKKSFEENEFAVAIDRASILFHASCFKCAGCNQNLADNIYFYDKETNNIYCGRDYAKIRGYPRCDACDELIFTKEYCLAENSTFHLKHFCCFQCDKPLAGQDYTLVDEKPYCLPCFETSKAEKCNTCMNVIKPDEIGCQLNDVHFHADDNCFSCIVCRKPLMGKKLLLRNKKLFCSHDCFNTTK